MAKHRKKEATDDFSELTDEELRQHASAAQQEFYRREKAKSVQNTLVVDDTAEPDEYSDPNAVALSRYSNVELTVELVKRGLGVYTSSILLGKKYRHPRSGEEGYADLISFFENACERVELVWWTDEPNLAGSRKQREVYDAVDLVDAETDEPAVSEKTGGPDRGNAARDLDLTHEEVENQTMAWFMTGDE